MAKQTGGRTGSGGAGGGGLGPDLGREVERVRDDAARLWSDVRELADGVARALDLERRARENPWAVVGAAAGLGFLLGGGLFRPVTNRLIRAGLRLAVLPVARAQIERLVGGAPAGAADEEGYEEEDEEEPSDELEEGEDEADEAPSRRPFPGVRSTGSQESPAASREG